MSRSALLLRLASRSAAAPRAPLHGYAPRGQQPWTRLGTQHAQDAASSALRGGAAGMTTSAAGFAASAAGANAALLLTERQPLPHGRGRYPATYFIVCFEAIWEKIEEGIGSLVVLHLFSLFD